MFLNQRFYLDDNEFRTKTIVHRCNKHTNIVTLKLKWWS